MYSKVSNIRHHLFTIVIFTIKLQITYIIDTIYHIFRIYLTLSLIKISLNCDIMF